MGYQFDNSGQVITYGTHIELDASQDMSLGMWIYYISSAAVDDKNIIGQHDTFPVVMAHTLLSLSGNGVRCDHFIGGGFRIGVSCVPGAIAARYTLGFGQWRYFAFSRSFSAMRYDSWFGSRAALVDGQTANWLPGQGPIPFGTPGQGIGPWEIGTAMNGVIIGPTNYWDTYLTREQHLSMARCTLPTGVDLVHLLWWTKMFEGAADIGPNMWANTFGGTPLPTYVDDSGCTPQGTGIDYRLYNT